MLQSLDLIAPRFVMPWDDLDADARGAMTSSFMEIARKLQARAKAKEPRTRGEVRVRRLQVNGWLGEHEHKHNVGVVYDVAPYRCGDVGVRG